MFINSFELIVLKFENLWSLKMYLHFSEEYIPGVWGILPQMLISIKGFSLNYLEKCYAAGIGWIFGFSRIRKLLLEIMMLLLNLMAIACKFLPACLWLPRSGPVGISHIFFFFSGNLPVSRIPGCLKIETALVSWWLGN